MGAESLVGLLVGAARAAEAESRAMKAVESMVTDLKVDWILF